MKTINDYKRQFINDSLNYGGSRIKREEFKRMYPNGVKDNRLDYAVQDIERLNRRHHEQ